MLNAASGIDVSSNALDVISHNVANARTPDYTREVANQSSLDTVRGVVIDPTTRDLDVQLQTALFGQNAVVASLTTRQGALEGIDAVQGATASGDDLGSLLANLQASFTNLATNPSDQTQQSAVIVAAGAVADQINRVAGSVAAARQSTQNDAVAAVADLTAALTSIGTLSDKIIAAQGLGRSTADLENQRDAAIDQASSIVPVRAVAQASGDVVIVAQGGLVLPTRGTSALTLAPATLGTGSTASAAAPSLRLGGADVTAAVIGGRLGADLTLRDATLPGYQAGLDEFAQTLATRFDAQGLTLFSNASGTVPNGTGVPAQSGYLGFSSTIQVNPAAMQSPSVTRDGLQASTPTAPSGRAGDTSLIQRILSYTFGTEQADGVPQPAPLTANLGPGGTVSLPYAAPTTLTDFAATLVASMSGDVSDTKTRLDTATSLQTALQGQLSNASGVSIDQEMANMVQVQNAYAANGKVVAAVQAMWTSLLTMVG